MMNLNNKVIVITGAGSGIGRALALQLANLGATVALNDWNKQTLTETLQLIEEQGGTAIARAFDVSDRREQEAFAEEIEQAFGRIDGLINNAGLTIYPTSIAKTDPIDFERVVNVNLWGVIHGSQVFIPYLKKQEDAFLVNMSSLLGLAGYAGQGPYVTTKFAVRGFTETLRQELYRSHVNVLSVHPGPVSTGLTRHIRHSNPEAVAKLSEYFEKSCRTTPEEAATKIIDSIMRRKSRLVFGRFAWQLDLLARVFPASYHRFHPSNFKPGRLVEKVRQWFGQSSQTKPQPVEK